MSKNYPEKEVDVNAMDQEELTALANDDATTEPAPAKKRVFSRILALILALAPIALMCFMPITMFYAGNGAYLFGDKVTLLQVFMNIFKKNGVEEIYKLAEITSVTDFSSFKFHGVPLFNAAGNYGKVYSWFLYAFPVVFLLNIVFMLFGVFSGKKAPAMVRAIAFTDMLLFGGYALLILFLSAMPFNTGDKFTIFPLWRLRVRAHCSLRHMRSANAKAKSPCPLSSLSSPLLSQAYTYMLISITK